MAALPSHAYSICDDLWFARNFYFDRAGHCFGSVLEEEVFDNVNCNTDAPELSLQDKARVLDIQKMENEFGCKLDQTERRDLNVENLQARRSLIDQPIRTGLEIVCVGYTGPRLHIYPDQNFKGKRRGRLKSGDTVAVSQPEQSFEGKFVRFVYRVLRNKRDIELLGWLKASSLQPFFSENSCARLLD